MSSSEPRLFGSPARATLFLVGLSLFGVGGSLFLAGMLVRIEALYYTGIALIGLGIPLVCYLAWTVRKRPSPATLATATVVQLPPYVYRSPGMKYNKSDSDLQLTAATADDGSTLA